MGSFFQGVFQTFFLAGYVIIFVVTILILQPFKFHRRRNKSTIALKVSYLLFLLAFLIFTYLLLFGEKVITGEEEPYDTLFNIHFIFFLTSAIVPNIGIMIRRRIKKNRIEYNILFTIINSLYFVYLMYLSISDMWELM